jgi:polar amino acid transport system substrate-binding protein
MKKFRNGLALVTGLSLLAGLSACANPSSAGTATDSGAPAGGAPAVEVAVDEEIAAMVPEEIRSKGSFTVSINPDIAPIKYVDENGEMAGLVPDLLVHAGAVMDLDVNLAKGTFDGMIPGIESNRFEVIGSINDFKERQATVDFIDYLKTGSAILVAADHESDEMAPQDLCGLRVGYGRGTVQQGLIEEASAECQAAGKEAVSVSPYGDGGAALLGVKSGQDDAYWGDAQSLLYNAKTTPDAYKVVYKDVAGPYGIGLNKENTEFRDALREAMLSLVEDGTYDELLEKWGQEEYAMPDLPLNTGPALEK